MAFINDINIEEGEIMAIDNPNIGDESCFSETRRKEVTSCDVCNEPIYENEEYYEIDGHTLCDYCMDDYLADIKKDHKKIAEVDDGNET